VRSTRLNADDMLELVARHKGTGLTVLSPRQSNVPLHDFQSGLMAQVLSAVPVFGLEAVLVAAELVLESGVLSAEHVQNVHTRLQHQPPLPTVETALTIQEAPIADTGRYDSLRSTEVSHA